MPESLLDELLARWHALRRDYPNLSKDQLAVMFPELHDHPALRLQREVDTSIATDSVLALTPTHVQEVASIATPTPTRPDPIEGNTAATVPLDPKRQQFLLAAGPAPNVSIPGYTIERLLGRGGMGVVYRARDLTLRRDVAVKLLHEGFPADSVAARRFVEEACITGQIQHPGVPAVYQVGTTRDGRPFLAMKLIQGRTLAELLNERPDPFHDRGRFVAAFEQVCQTLAYAHAHRVVHRDLKPSNVMVGAFGEVQVMDWGLAKVLDTSSREQPESFDQSHATMIDADRDDGIVTRAGSVLGTPAFMPPEQALGDIEMIDQRADVFALGAVLCVILTGKPPFLGESAESIRLQSVQGKLEGAFARLDASGAEPELVSLAKRCLAPERDSRPRDAEAVAQSMREFRLGAEERARLAELERAQAVVKSAEERKRRRIQLALAASVMTLMALVGIGGWLWQQQANKKAQREGNARVGVEATFERLPELYRRGLWQEALVALDQADKLLEDDGDPALRSKVASAKENTRLLAKLDTIRLDRVLELRETSVFDAASSDYEFALASAGFDILNGEIPALKSKLNSSPVRDFLVAALEDWAFTERDKHKAFRIELVIRLTMEHQHWRSHLAEAFREPAKFALLYATIPNAELSPSLIEQFGMNLEHAGGDGIKWIETSLSRYPNDFWLHFSLANLGGRKQAARRVGAARTALALRPGTAAVHFSLGHALYDLGDLDRAVAALEEGIALDPTYPRLRYALGTALADKGDFDRAIREFNEAIRLDPTNIRRQHHKLGMALFNRGEIAQARAAYESAIRCNPKDEMAHSGLGLALANLGDREGALREMREAVRLNPKQPAIHFNRGVALTVLDDRKGAIDAYREAIRLDPSHADAHLNLSVTLNKQGDRRAAIQAVNDAIRRNPSNPLFHVNLGGLLQDSGDYHAAIRVYREAARLNPKLAEAHYGIGIALYLSGDPKSAIGSLNEAIRLNPKKAIYHVDLGNALNDADDLDGAFRAFEAALRIDPKNAMAHNNLGQFLIKRRNDMAGARCEFEAAARLDPASALVRYNLGRICFVQSDIQKAIAELREAIRLNPRYASAHFFLGRALQESDDLHGAISALRKAVRDEPRHLEAHYHLGLLLYQTRDWVGAAGEFTTATQLHPGHAGAYRGLGSALVDIDDLEGATRAFRELVRLEPSAAESYLNLGLTLQQQGLLVEALACLRKGHEIGSARPNWRFPSAEKITDCSRLIDLGRKLPDVKNGTVKPSSIAEAVEFAELSMMPFIKEYGLSLRLWKEIFAAQQDLIPEKRFPAVRAAVRLLAGDDSSVRIGVDEWSYLTRLAFGWLRENLEGHRSAAKGDAPQRKGVAEALARWQRHPDLAAIRDANWLAAMPPADRRVWEQFWKEVEGIQKEAARLPLQLGIEKN